MAVTDSAVVQFVQDNRGLAEKITLLKAAIDSRITRWGQQIGPLTTGAAAEDRIVEGRDGVLDVTVYQCGALMTLLGDLQTVLAAANVDPLLEAHAVRSFEGRSW